MRASFFVLPWLGLIAACAEPPGCTNPGAINFDPGAAEDDGSCIVVGSLYEGGVLAHVLAQGDPGYDPDVVHGLVAYPHDLSTGMRWSNGSFVDTGATDAAIGAGRDNTERIVEAQGPGTYAAAACWDAVEGGFEDWYLPTDHELDAITRFPSQVGGFDPGACYWSSTQLETRHSWMKCLDGRIADYGYYDNESLNFVRPIRSF